MKARLIIGGLVLLAAVLSVLFWVHWQHDAPRRSSLQTLEQLRTALNSPVSDSLLDLIVMPAAMQGRTASEQTEFISKALHDEISVEGLAVLKKQGAFGPLEQVFPNEGKAWADQAGVKPEDCVAFKLERNDLRAEVVLAKLSTLNSQPSTRTASYRIVRCNNVKQLAGNF